ncbi:stress response protein [Knoellia flava TL1]|uniref:Stress response protein n=1 Tax=Knoellia flava TL1 TaxID=1385518 RepID=A0ABR4XFQ3_9MICO|nr:stress response protein [Knoellia flava TL1]
MECYIEVPFMLGEKKVFPDGLIRVSRGTKTWTALVEVKTGSNELTTEQLENYLDVAREQGFDALLTISNEIPAIAGQHPTKVDKRKLRKVELRHLSWSQVLAEAVMQKEFRGVADPDQAWILGELIRYLEHTRSGALEFDDMGESWTGVRDAVATATLRATDKNLPTVVSRFDALLRFTSLSLGRRLGTEVVPVLSRKELADPSLRASALTQQLAGTGQLSGTIRVPDTAGHLVITADLRAGQITCHVDIDAPREGRPTTRVNWLIRQLKNAPETTRIECMTAHSRGSSSAELLRAVRENPGLLVSDPAKEIRSFRVALTSPLGTKRGRGRGAFIDSVLTAVDAFYANVLGDLKTWSATPPKLRPESPTVSEEREPIQPSSLVSTDYSSQDGPDQGDGSDRQAASVIEEVG